MAAELTVDEVVRLFVHYQNKNLYLISRDGTVMRDNDRLYSRSSGGGGVATWTWIATVDREAGHALVNAEERHWTGVGRAYVLRELRTLCGHNDRSGMRSGIEGETMISNFTLPRLVDPEYTRDEIERVTGISYNHGSALRITHANGRTTSYHVVERLSEVIEQAIDADTWNANPEAATTTTVTISALVRMAESRYDKPNDVLPPPHWEYCHPDGSWHRTPYRKEHPLLSVDPDGMTEEFRDDEDEEEESQA